MQKKDLNTYWCMVSNLCKNIFIYSLKVVLVYLLSVEVAKIISLYYEDIYCFIIHTVIKVVQRII